MDKFEVGDRVKYNQGDSEINLGTVVEVQPPLIENDLILIYETYKVKWDNNSEISNWLSEYNLIRV